MTWDRRSLLALFVVVGLGVPGASPAQEAMAERIAALTPEIEAYVAKGMADFGVPGVAVGLVTGDRLVYAKGFGVGRTGGAAVDSGSVFQIGSTTKAFLSATLAIAVDRGKLAWDDRVIDRYPDFRLADPWVTREFRVYDMMAQRSGLPPSVNDAVALLGFDQPALIRSLRWVEPVASFRSTFSYTNVTHMLAGRVVAAAMDAPDWPALVRQEILEPLGMTSTSLTAEAIEGAADGTIGHLWAADGVVEVPFTPLFPYAFDGAGAINSSVDDLSRWVRMQLAGGTFEGKRIVSAENLAVTKLPRVAVSDTATYAMGWVNRSTPNGTVVWHNGGTTAYGAFIGLLPDRDAAVIVLSNATNVGLPDAIGQWTLDRLLGNPEVDFVASTLKGARAADAAARATFATPADAAPPPPLAPLAGRFPAIPSVVWRRRWTATG